MTTAQGEILALNKVVLSTNADNGVFLQPLRDAENVTQSVFPPTPNPAEGARFTARSRLP